MSKSKMQNNFPTRYNINGIQIKDKKKFNNFFINVGSRTNQ